MRRLAEFKQRRSAPPPARHAAKTTGRHKAHAHRALIVEDDDDTRAMYASHLREEGWEVEEAANGLEALHVVRSFSPDVIVMDLAMPELDGLEVTRRLKRDAALRAIPIVVVTAFPSKHVAAFAAGCDAFVTKPVTPTVLKHILVEALDPGESSGTRQ